MKSKIIPTASVSNCTVLIICHSRAEVKADCASIHPLGLQGSVLCCAMKEGSTASLLDVMITL